MQIKRIGTLTVVLAATAMLTGCQQEDLATPSATAEQQAPSATSTAAGSDQPTSSQAGDIGPDGTDAGRREHLSDKGGYIIDGSTITFVYSNGTRYPIAVGQQIPDQAAGKVKTSAGTLTLKNGTAAWTAPSTKVTAGVDQAGAGTVIDRQGAVLVLPNGSTTCADAQGLQLVGSDGTKASASKNGAFYVDAQGKRTSYGKPSADGKPAGRFTVCTFDKTVSVDLFADVLFDYNTASLTPAGVSVVNSAAKTIEAGAKGKAVKVVGHTDSKGSASYNVALGQRRANAVAQQLRSQAPGINLSVSSAGETQPVAANSTPSGADNPGGRSKNRRVVISCAR